ncbi:MAG: rhodanese-like domain-containing protein [Oscillospiraceae bacterium]|nr:rhodanese-like domain-containing protein [Oscillospiraceae bacterium]
MNTCIRTLSPQQARYLILHEPDHLLFDLRSRSEYNEMHLPGAVCTPAAGIAETVRRYHAERSTPILLYCRVGQRSRTAAEELTRLGYTRAYDIGGIVDWPYEVVYG